MTFSIAHLRNKTGRTAVAFMLALVFSGAAIAGDLAEIKEKGVLRHLGVPYANFVTGSGDGLDVELIKRFAESIGVAYRYVQTDWTHAFGDLTGKEIDVTGSRVRVLGRTPVKGDILASGVTILKWRKTVANFSIPTFPTQIWLLTRADFAVNPIKPTSDLGRDIQAVRRLFETRQIVEVMGKSKTCVDPRLYDLEATGAGIKLADLHLAELIPALIGGDSESTILDVPDALIALQKWTGRVKIIGPVSEVQMMAAAFAKETPALQDAFNVFFKDCREKGVYRRLVKKYYPDVFHYFPDFY